ncbi:MAG: DNA-processing protein DprA, partial [Gemmatimonadota bacterium]
MAAPAGPDSGRRDDELAAYLALTQVPGIGAVRLRTLLAAFGSAGGALLAPAGALAALPGFGPAAAVAVRGARRRAGEDILEALDRIGASTLLPGEAAYPPLLAEISEPPAVLYAWGDVALLARPAAALVGSRNHTAYGAEAARLLASGVARAGAVVVSGMARGLDAVAHQAALDVGGATVGVLGNGFGVVY